MSNFKIKVNKRQMHLVAQYVCMKCSRGLTTQQGFLRRFYHRD